MVSVSKTKTTVGFFLENICRCTKNNSNMKFILNFEKLRVSKQERILVHYDHILVSFMCQNSEVPGITHNTEGRS